MSQEDFADAALVLVGHGTTLNAESAAPVYQHCAELRRRGSFAEVREAFWKQEPNLPQVLAGLTAPRVFIVPLFISEGYFSETIIPRALGFLTEKPGGFARVRQRGDQRLAYCKPIGTHESMTAVLLDRARLIVEQYPHPRVPPWKDLTLFIAGHGTGQNEDSRQAIERQAYLIRAIGLYAAVHTVFLEEDPRIPECYRLAQTRNIVVVPFFISDGLHVREDIPVLLGESSAVVKQRLQDGEPTWHNPTEKHGKMVWYAPSVGTDPLVADVILHRVQEAAEWNVERNA
jgi:sirohydrochlorin cobaltochelatase